MISFLVVIEISTSVLTPPFLHQLYNCYSIAVYYHSFRSYVLLFQVVCSQVSCGTAIAAPQNARYGRGTGQIWLDDVQCTTQDEFLEQCRSRGWGIHNCNHGDDASVRCAGNCGLICMGRILNCHWNKCSSLLVYVI